MGCRSSTRCTQGTAKHRRAAKGRWRTRFAHKAAPTSRTAFPDWITSVARAWSGSGEVRGALDCCLSPPKPCYLPDRLVERDRVDRLLEPRLRERPFDEPPDVSSLSAIAASRLIDDSARALRRLSASPSSSRVCCSSSACRVNPSCSAYVRTVPYPAIS